MHTKLFTDRKLKYFYFVLDLPKNYPPPLQKAVSAQLLQGDKFNPLNGVHDETLNFIAWRGCK